MNQRKGNLMKKLWTIFAVCFLGFLATPASGYWLFGGWTKLEEATFSQANLTGTWSFFDLYRYGQLTIDTSGTVSGTITIVGKTTLTINGRFSLDSIGVVQGSATLSDGATWTISSGKMDPNKTTLFMAFLASSGYPGMSVLLKHGGTFRQADLAGTWTLSAGNTTSGPGKGSFYLDMSGNVTGQFEFVKSGQVYHLSSGALAVNGATGELIPQTLTTSEGLSLNLVAGKVDMLNNSLIGLFQDSSGGTFLAYFIRDGNTFTTRDLSGLWFLHGADEYGYPGYGQIMLDSNGTLSYGYVATPMTNQAFTCKSGNLSVLGSGSFLGTLTMIDQSNKQFGIQIPSGKIGFDKTSGMSLASVGITPTVSQAWGVVEGKKLKASCQINPNGLDTNCYLEYGKNGIYQYRSPEVYVGWADYPVIITIWSQGLDSNSDYIFRFVAYNIAGTTLGSSNMITTEQEPYFSLSISGSAGCFVDAIK